MRSVTPTQCFGSHSDFYSSSSLKSSAECHSEATVTVRWQIAQVEHINQLFKGLLGGKVIGLPPVLNFGSEELKARVVPEVLEGRKFICLAISEAQVGSDVLGLTTTAVKSEDGKEWIINGRPKYYYQVDLRY